MENLVNYSFALIKEHRTTEIFIYRATFVQEKEIFWTEVVSSDVRVIDGAGNNGSSLGGSGRTQTISGPDARGQVDPVNLRPINNGGFGIQVGTGWLTSFLCFLCWYLRK